MSLSVLQMQLESVMENLSNGDPVDVPDSVIDDAVNEFRQTLIKQLRRPKEDKFRMRMSNIGRATCQLQMQKSGAPAERRPYNHIMRMMIGDAVEVYLTALLRLAGANITGGKDKVTMDIAGTTIRGESDIDLDGAVWDIKSCSPWAYKNKWSKGYSSLEEDDAFGYIGQLYGYATGQDKPLGGWVVSDKSSGEVSFVEAQPNEQSLKELRSDIEERVKTVEKDAPFARSFEPEMEFFNRKPTGNFKLGMQCNFCDYKHSCWKDLKWRPQTNSKAQNPRHFWYTDYDDASN